MFAFVDDGGPAGDPDNWDTALDWNTVTHVIRNTHHPLVVTANGAVVNHDPLWPTSGGDSMLCAAHAHGVRVLADVEPLGVADVRAEMAQMLTNASAVRRAAREIAEWVHAGGYDGVSLDWEGLNDGSWSIASERAVGEGLVALVAATRRALRATNPASEVSLCVATQNNPWFNSSYRLGALAEEVSQY